MQAEPLYATAKKRAAAKGVSVHLGQALLVVQPRGGGRSQRHAEAVVRLDGNKAFDISTTPANFADGLKSKLGAFPFPAFWGPMAGAASTEWIADATAETIRNTRRR